MKTTLFRLIILLLTLVIGFTSVRSITNSTSPGPIKPIADVSWPNCSLKLKPAIAGIVGVNGGLDFRSNPCLYKEASSYSYLALYLNTGYPGPSYGQKFADFPKACQSTDNICLAYNYGYNAALYAITYANSQTVKARFWWLDVETDNSWTTNPIINRAALTGMVAAIQAKVFLADVGFYSATDQWQLLTGSWHNDTPLWVATGATTEIDAKPLCGSTSFNNGPVWLSQYTPNLDYNYICSPAAFSLFTRN